MRAALVAVLFTATLAHAAPKPPALRLDDTARPVKYAARVHVVPTEPTFEADIDIELTLKRATNLLWLNATGLTVKSAFFTVAGNRVPAKAVPGGDDFLGFQTAKPLPAGPATLHVDYSGKVSQKDDRGLFAQKENGGWYAISQFESIFARRVFPCFDEPGFKTPWQLTLE